MNWIKILKLTTLLLAVTFRISVPSSSAQTTFAWRTVVNNGVTVPGDSRKFNSYNQPSVNLRELVVFRARSKGGTAGEPAHGIFIRDMRHETPLITIFDRNSAVPQPNNLDSTFTEPPSFPRIDMWSNTIASRGNHQPVWNYMLSDGTTESRAGTTGIYTNPFGSLIAGASNLGGVPSFSFFAVPGMSPQIKFDVFPGSPAVTNRTTIVFKGNYSVPDPERPDTLIGETGVYYRHLMNKAMSVSSTGKLAPAGGSLPVVMIADSDTLIPGTTTKFGSTAPPSAALRKTVFAGFDNEESPTMGGIYLARLTRRNRLRALVEIGHQVPGESKGIVFNRLGEGVSFDGRFVAFWGAWGSERTTLILQCGDTGNKVRNAYCKATYPNGFETTVPVHQGIFVQDTVTHSTSSIAKAPTDFTDFVYWNYSGMVPGMGESQDTGEPARWRSATFVAVSGLVDGSRNYGIPRIAFKARTGEVVEGAYINPVDGIYLRRRGTKAPIITAAETGMDGTLIDPAAVDSLTGAALPVTTMGLERDGFRGNSLVINLSMGAEEAGWAGIYLTTVKTKDLR